MATGVDARIAGTLVKGVSAYSVDEESTPVDIADTTGATGRFSISSFSMTTLLAKRSRRKAVTLEDRSQGTTQGIISTPARSDGTTVLNASSRMTLLAVQRTAQPFTGTLGDYFIYLLSLVGITSNYVIDASLSSIPVTVPGWQGDVWFHMKKLLPIVGAEASLVSNNIVLRPLRGRVTVDKRDISFDWSVDDTNLARSVEGYYYNNQYKTNALAYPNGGWSTDVQVYQVDAGEVIEFDIPLEASLASVVQPVSQNFVGRYDVSASVYSVMSSDGFPYSAAQWDDEGGKIEVVINEDTRSLTVKITGSRNEQYAPFRIAATAGPSDNYSSLRILGEGVFFDKVLVNIPTGVSPDLTSEEVGVTIENEFITTQTQLFDRMIWTLGRFNGSRQTISVKTTGVNRAGDSGSYAYPTIKDFNAYAVAQGWTSIAQFNTFYSGKTIAQFNAAWFATVVNNFVNQAFGNIAGARTLRDFVWWRIRRATISPDSISYTAEGDTTTGDFDKAWTDDGVAKKISDFNTQWSPGGVPMTIRDFNVAPLERAAA